MVVPRRGPKVDLQSLSENLADMVDQAQGADPATVDPTRYQTGRVFPWQ